MQKRENQSPLTQILWYNKNGKARSFCIHFAHDNLTRVYKDILKNQQTDIILDCYPSFRA